MGARQRQGGGAILPLLGKLAVDRVREGAAVRVRQEGAVIRWKADSALRQQETRRDLSQDGQGGGHDGARRHVIHGGEHG